LIIVLRIALSMADNSPNFAAKTSGKTLRGNI
jgi:hypothetical protein